MLKAPAGWGTVKRADGVEVMHPVQRALKADVTVCFESEVVAKSVKSTFRRIETWLWLCCCVTR